MISFRPRVYRMMWDIFRFHVFAKDLLSEEGESEQLSIGEYLDREGYSQSFKEDYLLVSLNLFLITSSHPTLFWILMAYRIHSP